MRYANNKAKQTTQHNTYDRSAPIFIHMLLCMTDQTQIVGAENEKFKQNAYYTRIHVENNKRKCEIETMNTQTKNMA